jgi:hypothetical protein
MTAAIIAAIGGLLKLAVDLAVSYSKEAGLPASELVAKAVAQVKNDDRAAENVLEAILKDGG